MERYLRAFCIYGQDNWTEILPLAEFAANNLESATTKMTPFYATRGYHPRMNFDPVDLSASGACERLLTQRAADISERMAKAMQFVIEQTREAQEAQSIAANRYRKDVRYTVGNRVWLSTKNIQTERESKKLDHKMIDPFRVTELIGSACRQALPTSMKIHDVFHTAVLRKDPDNPIHGQINAPPPPVVVLPGAEEWEVEQILDAKKVRGVLKFKVAWKGYPPDETWYNANGFENSPDLVTTLYDCYPHKPRV